MLKVFLFFKRKISAKLTKKLIFLSVLLTFSRSVPLVFPVLLQKFIDSVEQGMFPICYIKILLVSYPCLFLIENFFIWIYGKNHIKAKNMMKMSFIRDTLLLNPLKIKEKGEGFFFELIEQNIDSILQLLTPVTMGKVFLIFQNIILVVVIFSVNHIAGGVCIALFLLYVVAFLLNNRLFSHLLSKLIKKNNESSSIIYDFISNNKILLSSKKNIVFAESKISGSLEKTSKLEFKLQYLFDLVFSSLGNFIQPCSNLLLVSFLGYSVVQQSLSFGTFVLILMYYNILQSGLSAFQEITDIIFHSKGAFFALADFDGELVSDDSFIEDMSERNFFLKLENLSISQKDFCIIKNKNAVLTIGKHYSLVGISGAGKSTFINVLLGLQKSETGEIYFLNEMNSLKKINLLSHIAWYSQTSEILNLTLAENIFLGDEINEAELNFYIHELSLEKLNDRPLGSNGEGISGGERQRVALARFLHRLTNKDFFIIDEGFYSVDAIMKEKMLSLVSERIKNKTGICISHDEKVLEKLCDDKVNLFEN